MNVETITMDKEEARERLRGYRTALHKSADEEYQAVAAGYEAMAAGYPIINYSAAIEDAPRDEKGRPMLAIARADMRQVRFEWRQGRTEADFSTLPRDLGRWQGFERWDYMGRWPHGLMVRRVDLGRTHDSGFRVDGYALVPLVPAEALNTIGGTSRLKDHLILWDVEAWSDTIIGAKPDIDPFLLRPIHGDLCAIVAQWDLTELERAVMRGRAVL